MRRQTLPIIVATLLVVASALFMTWAALRPTQAPPSTGTPTPLQPTNTTAPTHDGSRAGDGSIDLRILTMTLPSDWRYQVNAWPEAAPAELTAELPLLAAWQGDTTFSTAPLRFTLLAVERNALSLERYAADVSAQLSTAGNVTDVSTALAADFRRDTLPVAYVRYTAESPSGRQYGYQIATFDATGDTIIIATLVTLDNNGEEVLRALVQSMRFADMPAVPQEGA